MTIPSIEAVEYGRGVLEREIKRLQDFEAQAASRGDDEAAVRWGRIRKWLSWQVLGDGEGCVVTAFDERWLNESFRSVMGESLPSCRCDERRAGATNDDPTEMPVARAGVPGRYVSPFR